MRGLKSLKHLDYAVYNENIIVPLLMFDTDVWFQVDDDNSIGKCRIESKQRKQKKIKIGGQSHGKSN